MIRTIIFDFGNVVSFFDHGPAIEKLARYPTIIPQTIASIREILYAGDLEDAYEKGIYSTAEFIEIFRQRSGIIIKDGEFLQIFDDIFRANEELHQLIPILAKRYRLLLASNTNEAHCQKFRKQFSEILSYFSHQIVSQEIGERKPNWDFYASCQEMANAEISECVFIDDLAKNVEAARAFGWQTILYRDMTDLTSSLADLGVTW